MLKLLKGPRCHVEVEKRGVGLRNRVENAKRDRAMDVPGPPRAAGGSGAGLSVASDGEAAARATAAVGEGE